MAILDEDNLYNSEVSETAVQHLNGTTIWIKFVSIFGFVAGGLQLLGNLRQFNAVGIAMTILSIYLYYLLLQSGNKFSAFVQTRNSADLNEAFAKQKQYWMITSILLICSLIIITLAVFIVMMFFRDAMEQIFDFR